MTRRTLRIAAFAACLVHLGAGPVQASTDGSSPNWSLSEFGGSAADLRLVQTGSPGVLMASGPASLLFIAWRRLHGQPVSDEAAASLAVPCCSSFQSGSPAVTAWLEARKAIPGAPVIEDAVPTERPGPDYTSVPNCLDDAFRTAAATVQDRARAHGAASPDVGFWLTTQDTVFRACAKPGITLPPLPDAAPDWLRADYRYQSAALAFYDGSYTQAADAFAAIARDAASPWHDIAPYLRVRALLRRGLASASAADLGQAQQAAAAIPPDSPLHAAATSLGDMAQLRAEPAAAAARLTAALGQAALTAQAAAEFKDLQSISARTAMPDPMDWITTIKTGAAAPPVAPDDSGTPLDRARAADERRATALTHARDRFSATRDPAWLLAVLALMQPGDPDGGPALAAAAALEPTAPAYPSATYHRIRLSPAADPGDNRATLDAVLARTDLTSTTRNLFLAERMLQAADPSEMALFSLRQRICIETNGCKSQDWGYSGQGAGLFDGPAETATRGLGDDARYLIDRMALSSRMTLGADPALPAPLQLDLALTNFAHAVLLRDTPAVDALSRRLQGLLPVMAPDFAAIPAAPAGPDRQFAEFMILAKIPGLRVDLVDYTRPVGTVADFGGTWPNWVVLAKPEPDIIAPAPILYDGAAYQVVDVPAGTDLGNGHIRLPDVVCAGLCGAGGFVPQAPRFLAGTAALATAERRFLPAPGRYADAAGFTPDRRGAFPETVEGKAKPLPAPAGAIYVWDAILDYAARHPRDPRVPEALHWLVHVGHYGQSHNHSGKRAFLLLKSRYPASPWAKQNQFYYD